MGRKKSPTKIQLINEAIKDLMNIHKWLVFKGTDELYVCQNGVWSSEDTRPIIAEFINGIFADEVKQTARNETYMGIRSRSWIPYSLVEENFKANLINTVDGVFNIETGQLRPVKPDDYFFYVIPIRAVEDAKCPKIDKFFREIVKKKGDSEETFERKVETLYQLIGYCLFRDYPFHKIIILVGEGSNGKSTFLRLLETFLGKQNIARESLQNLAWNRFATIRLHGKLANLYADVPSTPIKYTGRIKMLTGQDPIGGEKKYVQGVVPFTNYAKLIFSCNLLPKTEDNTRAWFRRQLIIDFPNTFSDNLGNCDKDLLGKLITKEELAGLFQRAVQALKMLLIEGKFAYYKSDEEWENEYLNRSDSVKAFFRKMVEDDNNNRVPKQVIYQSYVNFCTEKRLPPYDPRIFWTQARQHIPYVESRPKIGKGQVRCIDGVKLLDANFSNKNYPILETQTRFD